MVGDFSILNLENETNEVTMTTEQYYAPAIKKINEIKAAGKDPFAKARGLIEQAKKGRVEITLKALNGEKDSMKFYLRSECGLMLSLDYDNGVKCHGLPLNSFPVPAEEQLTEELIAMAYNWDLTWKQRNIDECRAKGYDL